MLDSLRHVTCTIRLSHAAFRIKMQQSSSCVLLLSFLSALSIQISATYVMGLLLSDIQYCEGYLLQPLITSGSVLLTNIWLDLQGHRNELVYDLYRECGYGS